MLLEEGGVLESALVDIEFGLLFAYNNPDDTTAKITTNVSGDALVGFHSYPGMLSGLSSGRPISEVPLRRLVRAVAGSRCSVWMLVSFEDFL